MIDHPTVLINGQSHPLSHTTLGALLVGLALPDKGVAVAVNEQVIARTEWPTYPLSAHDRIEIIRAMAGG